MDKVRNILVLGVSGMLGSMVYKYFCKRPSFITRGTVINSLDIPFDKQDDLFFLDINGNYQLELKSIISVFEPDYIINCTGIINKYCRDNDPLCVRKAILVNSMFPHELSSFFEKHSPQTRII